MTITPRELDLRIDQFLVAYPPTTTPDVEFLGAQFDAGLAFIHFPEGRGGLGASPSLLPQVTGRFNAAGAPSALLRNVIGYGMCAPTLVAHGTEEQQDRYLRPLFTGEEIWCQLFSEPGAGSDVATLATRAVRDGEEWIVTGQKVWTTLAHQSRFGLIIARTDPDAPKHAGLTAFVVDMTSPGVEVRPLYQITGEAEFNECFFTDVRVPDDARLGAVGEGWKVAITTLMNERVSIGGATSRRNNGPIGDVLAIWRDRWAGRRDAIAYAKRDQVLQSWVRNEVVRLTNKRAADSRKSGTPGPEGSTAKLAFAEENKRTYELAVDLLGADGMLFPDAYPQIRPAESGGLDADPRRRFLRVRANSIEGGTSEVMRNILGERVLGLPGEPRLDKDVAWRDIPRG
jgi:alkylation response protein AidB-like acyl-CoA dehydrogenase